MKNALAVAVFILAMVLAQVVGVGVITVLGPLALEIDEPTVQLVAVAVASLLGLVCALIFLKGCLRLLIDQLQSPPARRGGG